MLGRQGMSGEDMSGNNWEIDHTGGCVALSERTLKTPLCIIQSGWPQLSQAM
jgi:hypothetical protein